MSIRISEWQYAAIVPLIAVLVIIAHSMINNNESITAQSNPSQGLTYTTSWIGNTYGPGGELPGKGKHVQLSMLGMAVSPDGTVYANAPWDEAGREGGVYKNGDVLGQLDATHGWGRSGGTAIAVNDNYIYMAMTQKGRYGVGYPNSDDKWYCVRRYNRSNYKGAKFKGGNGYDKSMLIINTNQGLIRGIAADNSRLYVSDTPNNKIKVYDAQTMKPVKEWSVNQPDNLALDKTGSLWVIQNKTNKILKLNIETGKVQGKIDSVRIPTAIVVDNQNRLLVGDGGPDNQIKIFKNLDSSDNPTPDGTFGVKGGIYSGSPQEIGKIRPLHFNSITGIGVDQENNIYVASDPSRIYAWEAGGLTLDSYKLDGTLNWKLQGLLFIDIPDIDPADETIVHTKNQQFKLDYSKSSGQEWTHVAHTVNPFKYPNDNRIKKTIKHNAGAMIRRIKGRKLMFTNSMYTESAGIHVYRFNPETDGEVAIPTASFWGSKLDYRYWQDKNGNGQEEQAEQGQYNQGQNYRGWAFWPDDDGNIWIGTSTNGIKKLSFKGFDSYGSPIYDINNQQSFDMPKEFKIIQRLEYHRKTDTMYIAGYSPTFDKRGDWGLIGNRAVKYINWSKAPQKAGEVVIAYNQTSKGVRPDLPKSMAVSGDYLFVGYVDNSFEKDPNRYPKVRVYDFRTGQEIAKINPGPEVKSTTGWLDVPMALRVVRRKNGEYLLFAEEDFYAKALMYRIKIDP